MGKVLGTIQEAHSIRGVFDVTEAVKLGPCAGGAGVAGRRILEFRTSSRSKGREKTGA